MKKNLIVIVLSFFALQGLGQTETLFNRARVVGAFGGPFVEFSEFKGESVTSSGGGGGLIIDDFFIGGYGSGSINFDELIGGDDIEMEMGHGGFWLGYTYRSYKLVHIFASTKLGWGGIDIRIDDEGIDANDNIFVVSPEIGVELNIFRWFKIAGTAGYRSVTGVSESTGQTNGDFSGMTGTLTFRFGGFGDWKRSRRDRKRYNYD